MIKLLNIPIAILLTALFFFFKLQISYVTVALTILFITTTYIIEIKSRKNLFDGTGIISKSPEESYDLEELELIKRYPLYIKGTWLSREISASITIYQSAMVIMAITNFVSGIILPGGLLVVSLIAINQFRVKLDPGIFLRNSDNLSDRKTDQILTNAYNKFWDIEEGTPIFQTLNKY